MVVARSSSSCRTFKRRARGVDARGAYFGDCRDGFELLLVRLGVGSARVTKFPPVLEQRAFSWLVILGGACGRREARGDHGRALHGERPKQVCACPPPVMESEKDLK